MHAIRDTIWYGFTRVKKETALPWIVQLVAYPLRADRQDEEFDVFEELVRALQKSGLEPQNEDVLVVSSKYLAVSQGRTISVGKIAGSAQAAEMGRRYRIPQEIAEAILRESDEAFGGTAGFILTVADGIIAPNAGIDRSSAGRGRIVLYPQEPYLAAEQIRRKIFLRYTTSTGVVIADSRLMPGRVGTTGVAIGCAGIEPVADMRGQKDLDGNPLRVTFQAVADNLATAGNHTMGEGAQSTPAALIRGSGARIVGRRIEPREAAVSPARCLYVRSLAKHTQAPESR